MSKQPIHSEVLTGHPILSQDRPGLDWAEKDPLPSQILSELICSCIQAQS